jgi:hypothetical protein
VAAYLVGAAYNRCWMARLLSQEPARLVASGKDERARVTRGLP